MQENSFGHGEVSCTQAKHAEESLSWQDSQSLAFLQTHCLSFCQPNFFTNYQEFKFGEECACLELVLPSFVLSQLNKSLMI
jgi:hypothetical protein